MTVEQWQANRHPEFEEGNLAGMTHGARVSELHLGERAAEIADLIRPLIPEYQPSDEVLLLLLATVLVRVERVNQWVAEQPSVMAGRGKSLPVFVDLKSWEGQVARYCDQLGLSAPARRKSRRPAGGTDALKAHLAKKAAE